MNWTKLFDTHLEKILPVRHVMRETGIPIELGNSRRTWKADYTFSLAGHPYVVEVKTGTSDTPICGMKVLAYQKMFNTYTNQNRSALIISRKENSNSADLLICGLLKISLLVIDFQEHVDKSILFTAKLDGSITYQSFIAMPSVNRGLESNPSLVESQRSEGLAQ